MNPGGGARGLVELAYLAFWWAAWSLADFYLLDWSPWSELGVLGGMGGVWLFCAAKRRCGERLRTSNVIRSEGRAKAVELNEIETV
tara:strand:+ start:2531 stop:2788 length:258 start_codon:yes stop_codon:yes gene_type:complete